RTSCADGSGKYRLGGAGAGNYLVRFSAAGSDYVSAWYGGALTADDAAVVSVPTDGHVDGVDGRLALGGHLSGTFTRPGGVSGCVYVYPADDVDRPVSTTCDYSATASATWTSEALPAGSYKIGFYSSTISSSTATWYQGATSSADATAVD